MAYTARDIIVSVSRTLFDEDNTRWTLGELLDYINDAIRAISTIKPNAVTETRTLFLDAGTLQTLPDECTVLARIIRNITTPHTDPGGPVGGPAIRMVAGRDLMDAFFPGWQSDTTMFGSQVQHAIYDPADLTHFYVIPGNDGTGMVEAIVGIMPATIIVVGDITDLENYAIPIPLADKYWTPLLDYVSFRAFGKDQAVPASEARSAKHLGIFQSAMQAIAAAEGDVSAAKNTAEKGS